MNSSGTIQKSSDLEILAKKVAEFERIEEALKESKESKGVPSAETVREFMTCIADLEAAYDRRRSQQQEPVWPALLALELAQTQLYLATVISQCPRIYQASYAKYRDNIFLAPLYHCECALFYAVRLHQQNPEKGPLIQAILNCLIATMGSNVTPQNTINLTGITTAFYVIDGFFRNNRSLLFLFKERLDQGVSHFSAAVTSNQLSETQKKETLTNINPIISFLRSKLQGSPASFFGKLRLIPLPVATLAGAASISKDLYDYEAAESGPGAMPIPIAQATSAASFYNYDVPDDAVIAANSKYFNPPSPR